MTSSLQKQALETLRGLYDRKIMTNIHRSAYVECLVATMLGQAWCLTYDWAPWDLEHASGTRLEVKQAAARQSWHGGHDDVPPKAPRFDIAVRKGYWTEDSQWVEQRGRFADIHVFAWHPETQAAIVDQRDPGQWQFFVLPTRTLPNQDTIGLARLERLTGSMQSDLLAPTVERMLPHGGDASSL